MNLITKLIANYRAKRQQRKFKAAHKVITETGLSVVNIQNRAGTNYIVSPDGEFFKIGKRA